ncbi:type VI secretion system secreted protein Hcp [Paenibacillus phyllosphaerae]|uniref:Type VI secretion system secreted protein Hcp n=1 Tax=Paenibacillus phyllosphaerae TaxID=274593 RepID=A0A7W5FN23_9BACL|nr:type VI secretion system tube protein Hcp [Paenibacillus phyllosphaerae]MBB3110845.1 type VI secretion system secreted protein Hcp [Paenibacillus phyllosphaerae]
MKKLMASLLAVFLLLLHAQASPASAAASGQGYQVFLQLEGIQGESTVKGYEKWIELSSLSYQFASSGAVFQPGIGGGGKVSFDSFAIAKQFDASSIPLMLQAFGGKSIPKGKIVFTRANKGSLTPILMFELDEIFVQDYSFSDTQEDIKLVFSTIKWTYWPIDAKGSPMKPITGGWDIEQHKPA